MSDHNILWYFGAKILNGLKSFKNKNNKKVPENRSFPGQFATFLTLRELRRATGGLESVLFRPKSLKPLCHKGLRARFLI